MAYIDFGIDLGTTNSCLAQAAVGGEVRVIQNNDQMNVTPSVVRVLRSGSLLVGRRAYNAIAEDPDNVALEFKRVMGQKYAKTFPAAGRVMTPEELSAEVLKSLLADARRRTGEDALAAVVTVPAAFGALQCEATARAAALAGLEEYPLLQEPIAAALAYGAEPGARDQRWLVFDLGGGTLDVAVVSTREGRLHVLEHRGDNHLGGKDVDRAVVENIFLPFLGGQFALPDPAGAPLAYNRLVRKLTFLAEYAKIELTSAAETVVSLLDLGEDAEGRPVEAELPLTRARLEEEWEPLLRRCLRLTDEALGGARLSGQDVDRVLLVGGPTQTPYLREALAAHTGARVDSSLDPMTVVARGAALYAASVERKATATKTADKPAAETLSVRLAFDPVSATLRSRVAGRFARRGWRRAAGLEVKLDAEGGFWTSGWLPVEDDYFESPLALREGRLNTFTLSVRDRKGRALAVEPREFQIRHGLAAGAPPLPHTLSVEVTHADGRVELSPVFPRRTLLPAEKTVTYRAAHTLRPSEPDTSLAVKLWEGEALTDPQANNWVGNVHVRSGAVRRPVPEGAEIQLHIKVDASRLITVEVFIPHLNEHFHERLYLPREEETDYLARLATLHLEVESCLARLARLEEHLLTSGDADPDFPEIIYDDGFVYARLGDEADDESLRPHRPPPPTGPRAEAERLRREIEDFDLELGGYQPTGEMADHDYARGAAERMRALRARVADLERRAGLAPHGSAARDAASEAARAESDVLMYGTEVQRERFAALKRELGEASARDDARGVRKILAAMKSLRGQVLHAQDWFWENWFDHLARPGREFVNREEADRWLAEGRAARQAGDRPQLQRAVRGLWSLQPPDEQAAAHERVARPGLKE